MTVLIIDTNWWIYFANSKDPDSGNFQENRHILLLEKMTQMMRRGDVQLLTSEIVL